eukprot:TRINITY_DN9055_c0_g1_i7.p1 TRINITY_DN9055_c0_g1~~TRINITY_DN9055_c0_g1_i7.p1  ORF type:complete len:480 (-),score=95.95 TRINITY_DN9055_c0_g1_i7:396-1835(-)
MDGFSHPCNSMLWCHRLMLWRTGSYLMNPAVIGSCIGNSTLLVGNCAIMLAGLGAMNGWIVLSMMAMATSVYLSCHSLVLLIPAILLLRTKLNQHTAWIFLKALVLFLVFLTVLLLASAKMMGGRWDWIDRVYGSIIRMEDLRPNTGLHWYLFQSMFQEFRSLFLILCNFHLVWVTVPCSARYMEHPVMLWCCTLAAQACFKPTTSLADLGFYLPCLLMLAPYLEEIKLRVTAMSALLVACLSFPPSWSLWIHSGVGNANTFFTTTIVYNVAQIIIITGTARSYVKFFMDPLVEAPANKQDPCPGEQDENLRASTDKPALEQPPPPVLSDPIKQVQQDQLALARFHRIDASLGISLVRRKKVEPEGLKGLDQSELIQAVTRLEQVAGTPELLRKAIGDQLMQRMRNTETICDQAQLSSTQVLNYFEKRRIQVAKAGSSVTEYNKQAAEFIGCLERSFVQTQQAKVERLELNERAKKKSD